MSTTNTTTSGAAPHEGNEQQDAFTEEEGRSLDSNTKVSLQDTDGDLVMTEQDSSPAANSKRQSLSGKATTSMAVDADSSNTNTTTDSIDNTLQDKADSFQNASPTLEQLVLADKAIAIGATTTTETTPDDSSNNNDIITTSDISCRFCMSKDWESKIFYKCGTNICKYFPLSDSNPNPGWYNGTINMHYVSRNKDEQGEYIIWNEIHYDDGDIENMTQDELQVLVDQKVVTVSFPKTTTNLVMEDNNGNQDQKWRNDQKWLQTYERLKKFKAENGHCHVPSKYIPDPPLANWVRNQRTFYKQKTLRADRVDKLNKIGCEWTLLSSEGNRTSTQKWDDVYERLKKFGAKTGHCRVPQHYDPDPALGHWVTNQRSRYKKKTLAADRIKKLNDIGFEWILCERHSRTPMPEENLSSPSVVMMDKTKINDEKWLQKYERLKKYQADKGHCRVPAVYSVDPSLGVWVMTQRKHYKKGTITTYRLEKLNEIGFDWALREHKSFINNPDAKTPDEKWQVVYHRLKKYKEENGHCRVPGGYSTDPSLGTWVNTQRCYYKKGLMATDRIEKLNNIGFDWVVGAKAQKWLGMFERLKKFKEENGHCRVPRKYDPDPSLAHWVNNQRYIYKNGDPPMAADRIEMLNEIGFDWVITAVEKYDQNWLEKYDRLKKFRTENGHCRVPCNYSPDPSLGNWVSNQRFFYKKADPPMAADRIEKLNMIGFDWAPILREQQSTTKDNDKGADTPDEKWQERYDRLKKYKKETGHCRVPNKYSPDPPLGRWVSSQRLCYKKGSMSAERIQKLDEIGFDWVVRDRNVLAPDAKQTSSGDKQQQGNNSRSQKENDAWNEKYERLKQFKTETGHCRVPARYAKDQPLAHWVHGQRQFYKNKKLPAERVQKLNEIGFDWSLREIRPSTSSPDTTPDQKWLEKYEMLKEFKAKKGHSRVPGTYAPDPPLGYWVNRQRKNYKEDKLAADRIERLNEIGFEWVVNERRSTTTDSKDKSMFVTWDEVFYRLVKFKTENGHCRVPPGYSSDPFLGSWVNSQRLSYRNGFMADTRIAKLNEIDFEWVPEEGQLKTLDQKWLNQFDRLVKFKADNGHCQVPKSYAGDISLAGWVSNQRVFYRKGKLAADRIQKLNEIGFDWVVASKPVKNDGSGATNKRKGKEEEEEETGGLTQQTKPAKRIKRTLAAGHPSTTNQKDNNHQRPQEQSKDTRISSNSSPPPAPVVISRRSPRLCKANTQKEKFAAQQHQQQSLKKKKKR